MNVQLGLFSRFLIFVKILKPLLALCDCDWSTASKLKFEISQIIEDTENLKCSGHIALGHWRALESEDLKKGGASPAGGGALAQLRPAESYSKFSFALFRESPKVQPQPHPA